MKFYIHEVNDINARCVLVEIINAKNLAGAKVVASKQKVFTGTILVLTDEQDNILAVKRDGKWENHENR